MWKKRNLSVITIATLSDIIIYEMDMFAAFFLFVCFISSCKIFMSREGEAASKGGKNGNIMNCPVANWKRVDLGMQC